MACIDSQFNVINDLDTCKTAADYYGKIFGGPETFNNYPNGCYYEKNGRVYFNLHLYGKTNQRAGPICYNNENSKF